MAVSDSSVQARIDIKTNGEVLVLQPDIGALRWLSLDNISFYVE